MRRLLVLAVVLLPFAAAAQKATSVDGDVRPRPILSKTVLNAPLASNGPLLPEDAGTVSHVYWNGSALVDTKGNAWTMNGTVPQVAANASPFVPGKAGAGPYSAANSYQGPTALGEWVGDWSVTAVFDPKTLGTAMAVAAKMNATATSGWLMRVDTTGVVRCFIYDGALKSAVTTNAVVSNAVNVATCGRAGGTVYARANAGVVASTAGIGTMSTASASPFRLGRFDQASSYFTGVTYEIIAATTPYSDSLHAARFAAVWGHKTTLEQSITVTRALDTQTYVANGITWLAPAGTLATESAGASIWKASTNYALQSSTLSSGTAAVAPWALSTATVATTAGGAPDGSNWAEVTSSTNTGAIYQATTTASSATFSGGAMVVRASGSAIATVTVRCGGVPSACTCYPSGTCTASTGGASPNDCNAKATVAQTAMDLGVNVTCPAAITNPVLILYPGEVLVSTGTARFSMAHVEPGAYPTPYTPTAAAAVTRNATVATVPNPLSGSGPTRWCFAGTYTPGRSWGQNGKVLLAARASGANNFTIYENGGILSFYTDNAAAARKQGVTGSIAGWTGAQRIVFCDNAGTLTACRNGVAEALTVSGAGDGYIASWAATLNLASSPTLGFEFDGNISNVKVCKGATKCNDCR